MKVVTMKTLARSPKGTSGARRARRAGRLPAVIYGEERTNEHVSLDMHDFTVALDHGARVIDLACDDSVQRVLLRDLQYVALGRVCRLRFRRYISLSLSTALLARRTSRRSKAGVSMERNP